MSFQSPEILHLRASTPKAAKGNSASSGAEHARIPWAGEREVGAFSSGRDHWTDTASLGLPQGNEDEKNDLLDPGAENKADKSIIGTDEISVCAMMARRPVFSSIQQMATSALSSPCAKVQMLAGKPKVSLPIDGLELDTNGNNSGDSGSSFPADAVHDEGKFEKFLLRARRIFMVAASAPARLPG